MRLENIKIVGKSGQIALGKRFAGKRFRLDYRHDGSMLLTPVVVIRESELWMLKEPHRSRIERGLSWAAKTPPAETDLDTLMRKMGARKKSPRSRGERR